MQLYGPIKIIACVFHVISQLCELHWIAETLNSVNLPCWMMWFFTWEINAIW